MCVCLCVLYNVIMSLCYLGSPFFLSLFSVPIFGSIKLYSVVGISCEFLHTVGLWLIDLSLLGHCFHRGLDLITLRASCGAVYCNRSCLWVCLFVCLWVCYHDNSILCASILTKLGLYVKVVTVSS